MDEWRTEGGALQRFTWFIVKGRLRAPAARGPLVSFVVHRPVDGGSAVRLEGSVPRRAWDRLHSADRRRLQFRGMNGTTEWSSDDVITLSAHEESRAHVRVELSLNSLVERTKHAGTPADRRLSLVFAEVPLFDSRFVKFESRFVPIRFAAGGVRFKLSRHQDGHGHEAPGIAGRITTVRTWVRIESASITRATRGSWSAMKRTAEEHADELAALLSFFTLQPTPWMSIRTFVGQHFVDASRPVSVESPRIRRPLIWPDQAQRAMRCALGTLARLRRRSPDAHTVLTHALGQCAAAVATRDLTHCWRAITLALDGLKGVSSFRRGRGPNVRERTRTASALRTLASDQGMRGASPDLVNALKRAATQAEEMTYAAGIHALLARQSLDLADFGGEALVRDIVAIRNALAHRGSLGRNTARDVAKRAAHADEMAFVDCGLPTERVALQLMLDRQARALCLVARILLRVLRVPDEAAPRAWGHPDEFLWA